MLFFREDQHQLVGPIGDFESAGDVQSAFEIGDNWVGRNAFFLYLHPSCNKLQWTSPGVSPRHRKDAST